MDEKFDQYGDSYTELATVETLRRAMDQVELDVCIIDHCHLLKLKYLISQLLFITYYGFSQDDLVNPEVDAFLEFQNELFNEEQCFKIFEKFQVYFDDLNLVSLINIIFLQKVPQ